MKSLLLFMGGGALLGLITQAIAMVVGDDAWLPAAAGFGLAFIPAMATLAWITISYRDVPDMKMMASLGGSGIRMAIALGGGYFLTNSGMHGFDDSFWFWLMACYFPLLALEIALLVRQQPEVNPSAPLPRQSAG